jgi:hypothetical protein
MAFQLNQPFGPGTTLLQPHHFSIRQALSAAPQDLRAALIQLVGTFVQTSWTFYDLKLSKIGRASPSFCRAPQTDCLETRLSINSPRNTLYEQRNSVFINRWYQWCRANSSHRAGCLG